MLGRPNKREQMFTSLKAMFPHIDLSTIDENLSFTENLQILVSQLSTPRLSQTSVQIENMKDAVDKQQLKIQKSLVNEQDVLGNIINRTQKREKGSKDLKVENRMQIIQQQHSSQYWNNDQNIFGVQTKNNCNKVNLESELMQDMWEFETQKGWFHH